MNAETNIDLPESEIRLLGIYRCVQEGKPVSMSMEDIVALPKLIKEIKKIESSSQEIYDQINTLNAEIKERMDKITELEGSIDPKIKYLHSPVVQSTKVHRTTNGDNPINKESVLKVLQDNPGIGNSEICSKIGVPNDKGNQNRAYTIVKQLQSDNKLTEDRKVI